MFMMLILSLTPALASECAYDSDCDGDSTCHYFTVAVEGDCLPWPLDFICDPVEHWATGECSDDLGKLRNDYTDDCMRPENGSQSVGTTVTRDTCAETSSRRWHLIEHGQGVVSYVNSYSDLCLTQVGDGYEQQECWLHNPAQQFELDVEFDGSFRIFHEGSADTCVRAHPNETDPFRSTTCDVNNTTSRHWWYE